MIMYKEEDNTIRVGSFIRYIQNYTIKIKYNIKSDI